MGNVAARLGRRALHRREQGHSIGGDADEFAAFGEFGESARADVAHAAFESADELVGEAVERAFVSDASFDAFRDGACRAPRLPENSDPRSRLPWRRWSPCRGTP